MEDDEQEKSGFRNFCGFSRSGLGAVSKKRIHLFHGAEPKEK